MVCVQAGYCGFKRTQTKNRAGIGRRPKTPSANLEQAQAEADKKSAEAAAEAAKILKSARDDAKETVENAAREAAAKAAEIRERNDEQLERDKLRMKDELKSELSGLVAEAAEAVVGKILTEQQRGELANLASKELKK